jgi:hypothetical protein
VAARFAADAGVMQIQLREDSVWRPSWDVRASTAANGEGGNVDKYSQVLWKDDVARREEKISWASRHNGTAPAEYLIDRRNTPDRLEGADRTPARTLSVICSRSAFMMLLRGIQCANKAESN